MFIIPTAKKVWSEMTKSEQKYILDIEDKEFAETFKYFKKINLPIAKESPKVLRDRQTALGSQIIYPKMTIIVVDDILIINNQPVYGVESYERIIDRTLPELALKTIRSVYQKTSGKRRQDLVLWRRALVHYIKEQEKKEKNDKI